MAPDSDTAGGRIRYYRERKNMKAQKLAGAVGVDPSRVSNWERNIERPSPENFEKLARTLGVDVGKLTVAPASIMWARLAELKALGHVGPECNLPPDAEEIADQYSADDVPEPLRNEIVQRIRDNLAHGGWLVDAMKRGREPTWGCTCPDFNIEIVTNLPHIQLYPLPNPWFAYERDRYSDDLRIFVLVETLKRLKVANDFRNDLKIRIASDLVAENAQRHVDIQRTDYLSSVMTDQLRWKIVRSKRQTGMEPQAVLRSAFTVFVQEDADGQDARLKGFSEALISNQLAASTFAFSNDGHLMIVAQNDSNLESVNLLAPSGSGSLDWSDLANSNATDLLSLVKWGANRELREECALNEQEDCEGLRRRIDSKVMVTGFARMLHRAGKPEFFCFGRMDAPSHEICDRKPERYVQRVVPADVRRADWSANRPSGEVRRVCADYLERAFLDRAQKRIPLSYPLEHGLKLLIEACEEARSSEVIDKFIQDDF